MDPRHPFRPLRILPFALACALPLLAPAPASAVPSFARQTSMECAACHNPFPQLTEFGRSFKLNGYTLAAGQAIEAESGASQPALHIAAIPPFSVMLQSSFTRTATDVPGVQNDEAQFPQQLSFFFAGSLTPSLGLFMQITYEPEAGSFGMDNTDLRFARQGELAGRSLVYGLTLNNNPTVQDVWNSTPAWGFPYAAPEAAPTPGAGTMIDGALGQEVAGLGAYGWWDGSVYLEVTGYRSAPQGAPDPSEDTASDTIHGVTPYWRAAWQHDLGPHTITVGTYGLHAELYPSGVSGLRDTYSDVAGDLQYEVALGDGLLVVHGTYIHEDRDLDASFIAGDAEMVERTLHTFRADVSYIHANRIGVTGAFFDTGGDADPLLYPAGPVDGFADGKPDSRGLIAQAQFLPWQNTQLLYQYTRYDRFNGAGDNYDGAGRDAGDNDTHYVLCWFAF